MFMCVSVGALSPVRAGYVAVSCACVCWGVVCVRLFLMAFTYCERCGVWGVMCAGWLLMMAERCCWRCLSVRHGAASHSSRQDAALSPLTLGVQLEGSAGAQRWWCSQAHSVALWPLQTGETGMVSRTRPPLLRIHPHEEGRVARGELASVVVNPTYGEMGTATLSPAPSLRG
jgi:hypothetical protein